MKPLLLLTTVPDPQVGAKLARALVTEGLAACVNILPGLTSIYRWQGKVEEASEHLLLVKTVPSRLAAVQERLMELHPYEVPELVAVEVEAVGESYGRWLVSATEGAV